jgi:hypothetical protein
MQDIWGSIERTNLEMMGVEEEVLQTKGRDNLFSNITAINFPNLKREQHAGTGGFQYIKLAEPEKKTPRHNNQQREKHNIENWKREMTVTYKGKPLE